jgi:hypothetical protein
MEKAEIIPVYRPQGYAENNAAEPPLVNLKHVTNRALGLHRHETSGMLTRTFFCGILVPVFSARPNSHVGHGVTSPKYDMIDVMNICILLGSFPSSRPQASGIGCAVLSAVLPLTPP